MIKKLQVFVSSTYTDLIEERQAAVQAILDAGHIPAGMELFKAGKSQMHTIQKWIDESDVYMLILGGRYGSIDEESGLSYTELEYKYALSKNMPVFAIVLDDKFLFTKAASKDKDTIIEHNNTDKYNSFKELVKSNVVKFVTNIDQIISVIHSHLNHIISDAEYHLIGWIRNDPKYVSSQPSQNLVGNYDFETLLNTFRTKVFEIPAKYTTNNMVKKSSALRIFYINYNLFATGLSNSQTNSEINLFFYYNIAPYFISFGLLERVNNNSSQIIQTTKIGDSFFAILETHKPLYSDDLER